jgi:hypothetical protein
MPTGKPKIGVVYRSAGAAVDPPVCIPAKAYEKKYSGDGLRYVPLHIAMLGSKRAVSTPYVEVSGCLGAITGFVSLFQIKRLLAKNLLCGVRFKRRLFIEDVPPPGY